MKILNVACATLVIVLWFCGLLGCGSGGGASAPEPSEKQDEQAPKKEQVHSYQRASGLRDTRSEAAAADAEAKKATDRRPSTSLATKEPLFDAVLDGHDESAGVVVQRINLFRTPDRKAGKKGWSPLLQYRMRHGDRVAVLEVREDFDPVMYLVRDPDEPHRRGWVSALFIKRQ